MQELQIFSSYDFGEIRTLEIDNEPWFVGKDIAEALGYSNPRKALIDHVDEEDKGVTKCDTLGGKQDTIIINESGMYSLIFSSQLKNAKKFKRWVTSEVLPQIRKSGMYFSDSTLIAELQTLKKDLMELRSGFVALQDSTSNSEMTMSDIKKIKASVYKKVLEVTGGKDANAYRNSELLHKVFTSIYSTTNYKMGVKTYKQIRHNQVDRYIQTVKRYDAPVELLCEIMLMNEEI